MPFEKGQLVRCAATFRTETTSALVDPVSVTFKAKAPSGALTTYTTPASQIVHDGTGMYHVDLSVTETGLWNVRFESTGTYQAAGEGTFPVDTSVF